MRLHHIGYYVHDMQVAIADFANLGYELIQPPVYDELRKINIAFCTLGKNNCVELVEAAEGCKLFSNAAKRIGSAPYHICYEVDDIEKAATELSKKGFIIFRESQPAPALGGRNVIFLYGEGTGQIELVERSKQYE